MSRTRKPYYVQQKVSIPATLLARFSQFHWDAAKSKVKYGAISDVLTGLLTDYVNRMENPSIVPDQEPPLRGAQKEKVL
jgi:hypothetical protein